MVHRKRLEIYQWIHPAFLLNLAMLFTLNSCGDEYLSDFPKDEPLVVINALFSPQDTLRLNLSLSENTRILQKDSFINNATVKLILPDQSEIILQPDFTRYGGRLPVQQGYYRLNNLIPFQKGQYQIQVNTPSGQKIVAQDIIPDPVPIQSCSFTYDSVNESISFLMEFLDPPDVTNYYSVSLDMFSYYTAWFSDRDSPEGGYYENVMFSSYNEKIDSENSFVEAILPTLSQIIFSDRNLPQTPESSSLRFKVCRDFSKNYDDSVEFRINLHSVSKNYYDHALSYYRQNQADKDFYSDPVTVASNVKGGYGIFAGYNTFRKTICYRWK